MEINTLEEDFQNEFNYHTGKTIIKIEPQIDFEEEHRPLKL